MPLTLSTDALLAALNWRYAVKKFDPAKKVPDATWRALEQSLVLSPSSFGLQPWRFVVVSDPTLREQLVAASWNQTQIKDASHLVVFAIKKGLNAADVDRFIARTAEVRSAPAASLDGYAQMIKGFVTKPGFDVDSWSARQLYIAVGQFLAACAVVGVDACPMEGISPPDYNRILGLDALGLSTFCAVPVGYRAADDKYAALPKVRFVAEDMILRR